MKKLTKAKRDQINRALAVLEDFYAYNPMTIESAAQAKNYFKLRLSGKDIEEFHVAYLDSQHRLIDCLPMSTGTINQAAVYPREIIKKALELNSAAMIIAHNHPSGDPTPSGADRNITEAIREAADLFDIRLLDHLVVGRHVFSFAEKHML